MIWKPTKRSRSTTKAYEITNREGLYNLLVNYRSGDMWAPQVEQTEALRRESRTSFIASRADEVPFNDGVAGLRVVKLLEAANQSVASRSTGLPLSPLARHLLRRPFQLGIFAKAQA